MIPSLTKPGLEQTWGLCVNTTLLRKRKQPKLQTFLSLRVTLIIYSSLTYRQINLWWLTWRALSKLGWFKSRLKELVRNSIQMMWLLTRRAWCPVQAPFLTLFPQSFLCVLLSSHSNSQCRPRKRLLSKTRDRWIHSCEKLSQLINLQQRNLTPSRRSKSILCFKTFWRGTLVAQQTWLCCAPW